MCVGVCFAEFWNERFPESVDAVGDGGGGAECGCGPYRSVDYQFSTTQSPLSQLNQKQ
jgi:hypothetical protein